MTQTIAPSIIEIRFNEMVNNVKAIIREARHMGITNKIDRELPQFAKFLDDVNFKVSFMEHSKQEDYLKGKMLDALDHVKDNWVDIYSQPERKFYCPKTYRVVNSIYDTIKEFYFEED